MGGSQAQELLSHGFGVCHPPGMSMFTHPPGNSPNLVLGDIMEALSCRHDESLTPFSALSPQENGAGAEDYKLLIVASLSGDQPHPGARPESPH